jgi:hypothetical protein
MDCRNFAIFISPLGTFPLKLAAKIGLERATYWYALFNKYGECAFEYVETIPILLGIQKPRDVFDSLVNLEYLERNNEGTYELNFDKIFEATEGVSLSAEAKPPFTDRKFITLLNDYITLLKSKGYHKKADRKTLYKLFEAKTLDQSINALKKAVDNKWVTLYFDGDTNKGRSYGANEGSKGRGNLTAGGGTNKDREGGFSVHEI